MAGVKHYSVLKQISVQSCRMKGMVNEIRKKWMHAGLNNTRNQEMIVDVTERIRSSFTQSIEGIHKADEKVCLLLNKKASVKSHVLLLEHK